MAFTTLFGGGADTAFGAVPNAVDPTNSFRVLGGKLTSDTGGSVFSDQILFPLAFVDGTVYFDFASADYSGNFLVGAIGNQDLTGTANHVGAYINPGGGGSNFAIFAYTGGSAQLEWQGKAMNVPAIPANARLLINRVGDTMTARIISLADGTTVAQLVVSGVNAACPNPGYVGMTPWVGSKVSRILAEASVDTGVEYPILAIGHSWYGQGVIPAMIEDAISAYPSEGIKAKVYNQGVSGSTIEAWAATGAGAALTNAIAVGNAKGVRGITGIWGTNDALQSANCTPALYNSRLVTILTRCFAEIPTLEWFVIERPITPTAAYNAGNPDLADTPTSGHTRLVQFRAQEEIVVALPQWEGKVSIGSTAALRRVEQYPALLDPDEVHANPTNGARTVAAAHAQSCAVRMALVPAIRPDDLTASDIATAVRTNLAPELARLLLALPNAAPGAETGLPRTDDLPTGGSSDPDTIAEAVVNHEQFQRTVAAVGGNGGTEHRQPGRKIFDMNMSQGRMLHIDSDGTTSTVTVIEPEEEG